MMGGEWVEPTRRNQLRDNSELKDQSMCNFVSGLCDCA